MMLPGKIHRPEGLAQMAVLSLHCLNCSWIPRLATIQRRLTTTALSYTSVASPLF